MQAVLGPCDPSPQHSGASRFLPPQHRGSCRRHNCGLRNQDGEGNILERDTYTCKACAWLHVKGECNI